MVFVDSVIALLCSSVSRDNRSEMEKKKLTCSAQHKREDWLLFDALNNDYFHRWTENKLSY